MTVISHIGCTYLQNWKQGLEARIGSLALEARLRDGRPKFRNAAKKVFKAKQNKATEERLRATFVRSPRKKLIHCQKREKKKPKSYSGRLLTASGGRQ